MASDPVPFDLPLFAEHDFSQHRFPKGMIETLFDHYRHHFLGCRCMAKYNKSYKKEHISGDNNGVTWVALKAAVFLALYEPIKPEILKLANQGFKPANIAESMANKYRIPYKPLHITKILSEKVHQSNAAPSSGHMATALQYSDQCLTPDIVAVQRAQIPVEIMEWDSSEVSVPEGPNFELPMHFGIHNVQDVFNGLHEEDEINALRRKVRELETLVSNQHDNIEALEIKAGDKDRQIEELKTQVNFKIRKVMDLKEENKKLREYPPKLMVYKELMEECHRFRHQKDQACVEKDIVPLVTLSV